jgi:hypothetical protein
MQAPVETPASVNPEHFEFIGGEALRTALGYRTGEAFRAAARAGRVQVKLVKIEGRRGWFARARDVQEWRAALDAKFQPAPMSGSGEHTREGAATND